MNSELRRTLSDPLIERNPVTLHVLGICSALAVTNSLITALIMSAAVISVLVSSNLVISLLRNHVPLAIRLIVQIIIIASMVIVADEFLKTFAYEISRQLSIYVSLIVTNCIILARTEAFAMHNPPLPSLLDGLGNGLGYAAVLVPIGLLRELAGSGTILGATVLPLAADGGWFVPLTFIQKPAAAFIILGLTVWIIRAPKPAQIEKPEFELQPARETNR